MNTTMPTIRMGYGYSVVARNDTGWKPKAVQVAKQVNDEVKTVTEIARAAYNEDPGNFHDGEISWMDIWHAFIGIGDRTPDPDYQRLYNGGRTLFNAGDYNRERDPNWVDPANRPPSNRSLEGPRTSFLEQISPQQWLQLGQSSSAKLGSMIGKQIWRDVIERSIEGKSARIPNAMELYQTYERGKEVLRDFKTLKNAPNATVDQHGNVRATPRNDQQRIPDASASATRRTAGVVRGGPSEEASLLMSGRPRKNWGQIRNINQSRKRKLGQ